MDAAFERMVSGVVGQVDKRDLASQAAFVLGNTSSLGLRQSKEAALANARC